MIVARDELGRLARAFNTMLAALADSIAAQRQLVADCLARIAHASDDRADEPRVHAASPGDAASEQRKSIDAAVVELARDDAPDR